MTFRGILKISDRFFAGGFADFCLPGEMFFGRRTFFSEKSREKIAKIQKNFFWENKKISEKTEKHPFLGGRSGRLEEKNKIVSTYKNKKEKMPEKQKNKKNSKKFEKTLDKSLPLVYYIYRRL